MAEPCIGANFMKPRPTILLNFLFGCSVLCAGCQAETEVMQTTTHHLANAMDGLDATRVEAYYLETGRRLFPGFAF